MNNELTITNEDQDVLAREGHLTSIQRYQAVIPTLQLSDDKGSALIAPLADSEISIHPSKGFLYIAHGAARTRIINAFGVGSLRMLASGPMVETAVDYVAFGSNKKAVSHSREYDVFITGVFFGNYVGGTDMRGNKPSSTNSELEEAIKSDIWKAVAKELGVGLELGRPEFTEAHIKKHYTKDGSGWSRRGYKPEPAQREAPAPTPAPKQTAYPNPMEMVDENGETIPVQAESQPVVKMATEGQRKLIFAKAKIAGVSVEEVLVNFGVTRVEDLPMSRVNDVVKYIEGGGK